jgi:hypothetical protein
MTVALDAFLLAIIGGILARPDRRKLFFHLMTWTFPLLLLAGFEEAANLTHLASRIAPFEDLSLLDRQGRWPAHLMSEARWSKSDPSLRLYQPWRGDGIVINELGLRTASPTPKSPGEWRVAISGGSTVWGWRVLDADTLPASVQRLLRPDHPRITVYNFGIESARLEAELATLKRFHDVYALDQVLFYTGVNDVVGDYQRETAASHLAHRLRSEAGSFELIKAAHRAIALWEGTPSKILARLDRDILPRIAQHSSLRKGIIAANEYCETVSLRCSFVLQPILPTRKYPVGPEVRVARTLELAFPRLGATTRELYRDAIASAEANGRISDFTSLLDANETPVFVDTAHMNEDGHLIVAKALVPVLLRGTR